MLVKDKKKKIEKAGYKIRKANLNSGWKFTAVKGKTEVSGTSMTNLYSRIFLKGVRA